MPVKYWLFPQTNSPSKIWNVFSRIVIRISGVTSKVWLEYFNKPHVYNKEILDEAVRTGGNGQGLVTVCNHDSCFDDPVTFGILKWRRFLATPMKIRWVLVADEICFTKYYHSLFFSLGKAVPVIRGEGVYQKPMDFVIEKLNEKDWVHIFPEGKLNISKEIMRLKWGVGRLIAEAKTCPLVIPYFHRGMDDILPNKKPYIPQIRKNVTILIGEPIDFTEDLKKLKALKKTPLELRKFVTDRIQEELHTLRIKVENLHSQHTSENV